MTKRGQPTKLTPEVQAEIVRRIGEGYTLKSAARLAGICERTLHNWLRWGRKGGKRKYLHFLQSVRAALKASAHVEVRGVPDRLVTARYESPKDEAQLAVTVAAEITRLLSEGRVPWKVRLMALEIADDETRDAMASEAMELSMRIEGEGGL